jgi:SAM-dependent MidA family methyltransferase
MARTSPDASSVPVGSAAGLIRAEILTRGPIDFSRFMELALYAPGAGYYEARAADDFSQDYLTSPELHPAFGILLCAQLDEMWQRVGRPSEFWLIEGGPGTGIFASDILSTADAFPDFAQALRVALIERSAALRATQSRTLAPRRERVTWIASDRGEALGPGCIFANELLDAFPVHRVVMRAEGLQETYVAIADRDFVVVEDAPTTSALGEHIAAGGGHLRLGDYGEVSLDAPRWLESASRLIDRGYVLLLDYGEPAAELYGERHPRGTLRCYQAHTMNGEPLRQVGMQDITAHIDLSAVARAGESSGLALLGASHQASLLNRLGLPGLRDRIEQNVSSRAEQRAHRAALDLLQGPRYLGRLAALLLGKGLTSPLSGFTAGAVLSPPSIARVPRLRIEDPVGLVESLYR